MRIILAWCLLAALAVPPAVARSAALESAQQWGVFELALSGPKDGNPFDDVTLTATFDTEGMSVHVRGFYDGEGAYRVRFMPSRQGAWRYRTISNRAELNGRTGEFVCAAPSAGNHGPVRVRNVHHFAYADGSRYVPIGTTCYTWVHQSDELQARTLATLKTSPFNKLRMCILPTRTTEKIDARRIPFETLADGRPDFSRFNVAFFQNLESRIATLSEVGVEADVILFHPYDGGQWGFDAMDAETDDRYVRYVVARLAAHRNVWWSLANEFDLMHEKSDADWDRFFQLVQSDDAYGHLRSLHHSQRMYDVTKPWPTHLSVQNGLAVADFGRGVLYRQLVPKPIVFDEVKYEGNLRQRWGQLSAEEMVLRFWMGTIAGTYVGHGEALWQRDRPSWLSKGGELRGESPARVAFLKSILNDAPPEGIEPIDQYYETKIAGKPGEYYLIYFGKGKAAEWKFELPRFELKDGMSFRVDVIDTWNMTITPVEDVVTVKKKSAYMFEADPPQSIPLPDRAYIALRVRRVP